MLDRVWVAVEWSYCHSLTISMLLLKECVSHRRWSYNHFLLYVLNINNDAKPLGYVIPIFIFFFCMLTCIPFILETKATIIDGLTAMDIVISLML